LELGKTSKKTVSELIVFEILCMSTQELHPVTAPAP
jgi:hypothetical protein